MSTQPIAERFGAARRLFPVYSRLAEAAGLATLKYDSFEDIDEEPEQVVSTVEGWFDGIDTKLEPAQFRHLIQAEGFDSREEVLRCLAMRFSRKGSASQFDRDKLDLLLGQYLATCAPAAWAEQPTVSLSDVASVLAPMVGPVTPVMPKWLEPLEDLVRELNAYEHLQDLAKHGIFERGRTLKGQAGEKHAEPIVQVAFARFNYLLRRAFSQLWEADLWWIEQALDELESRGEFFIDASSAQLSPITPTSDLFGLLKQWQRPLFTDYAHDRTYHRVQQIRTVLDRSLSALPV